MNEVYDLEEVYDAEIAPLMTQIIEICKTHGLPMLASFAYRNGGPGDASFCSTALFFDEREPERYLRAKNILLYGRNTLVEMLLPGVTQ